MMGALKKARPRVPTARTRAYRENLYGRGVSTVVFTLVYFHQHISTGGERSARRAKNRRLSPR